MGGLDVAPLTDLLGIVLLDEPGLVLVVLVEVVLLLLLVQTHIFLVGISQLTPTEDALLVTLELLELVQSFLK